LKSKKKSIAKKFIIIFILVLIFLPILLGLIIYNNFDKDIDLALLKKGATSVTKIYYFDTDDRINREGTPKELTNEAIFSTRNEWCSLYEIPNNLKNAFIAIEDKRFYEHNGVDWIRTSKAFLNYIFKFDKSGYGGSTITQQLIKNITGDNDFSAKRKIEEIFRAINIEKRMSKNEILESYLNVVYMSENCYGVCAAAKVYFDKTINDLSIAECATLASIVQNPTKYDPYINPENLTFDTEQYEHVKSYVQFKN
jgi:penicillin-binding protein 1A